MLRPLREEMGIAGGVRDLQWLFTATFLAMLVAVPVFGAVVARLPRRRFIPLVYHFFVFNIMVFWVLLKLDMERVLLARIFFVWISVFNLFAVSVFWSYMADLDGSEQGNGDGPYRPGLDGARNASGADAGATGRGTAGNDRRHPTCVPTTDAGRPLCRPLLSRPAPCVIVAFSGIDPIRTC